MEEIDRRGFLIASASVIEATAALAIASALPYPSHAAPNGQLDRERSLGEIVSDIRGFEAGIGNNPLTFNQALGYLPLLAEHFVKVTGSPTQADTLASNMVIVRRGYDSQEEGDEEYTSVEIGEKSPFDVNVVKYLQEDFPDIYIPEYQARLLVGYLRDSNQYLATPAAWLSGDKTFLVLDRINDSQAYTQNFLYESFAPGPIEFRIPFWQFSGFGSKVECKPPTSAVKFRCVAEHEMAHADNPPKGILHLSREFMDAYNRVRTRDSAKNTPYPAGQNNHFWVIFTSESGSTILNYELYLEEFGADYNVARISDISGLPYILKYAQPYEFGNFARILGQSGISDNDFFSLYRNHLLEELCLKVAKGAKGISFEDETQALAFSMDRLLFGVARAAGGRYKPFIWKDFDPFYQGMDLRIYDHVDPRSLGVPQFFASRVSIPYHIANATLSCA